MSYCKIYGSQVDGILFALQHQQKSEKPNLKIAQNDF